MTEIAVTGTSNTALATAIHVTFKPWLDNYASKHTQEAYGRDALLWEAWCRHRGLDLLDPLPAHVTMWAAERREAGDASATVARRVSSVLTFYKWARHEGLTAANPEPFRRPKVNHDDGDVLGLTREQYQAVHAEATAPRTRALIVLLGQCGLRISEALGAEITDVREQSGHRVIRVTGKGDRPRTVTIPASAWRDVSAYIGARTGGLLFTTRGGRRWDRRDAYETVVKVGRAVGLEGFHPHQLRHTAATLMLEAGAPLDRVQLLLGHSSPEVTMRYARARNRLDGSPAYDLERYLNVS